MNIDSVTAAIPSEKLKGAVSEVILRFCEPCLEQISLEKKDLRLHVTVECEVLSFRDREAPYYASRFGDTGLY
ncbi:MAG: hypothetical protein K0Q94_5106 [Paenibacillus sp.]|jgi:hypothetical protein|nr:hypothetical protein [Paenibacillus sp.]